MTQKPVLPSLADTLQHPAFVGATWKLEPDRVGTLSVAEGRGGPIRIRWEIHGQGPVRVVFIMGLAARKEAWQRQTLHFGHERRDRYSVLVLDNRGIGESDKPLMRYSSSEMARDVAEVLAHVGWLPPCLPDGHDVTTRSFHVVGISMGGMVAQEVACLVPWAVRSLSLLCTAAVIENTTTLVKHMGQRASMLLPMSLERRIESMCEQVFPAAWLLRLDDVRLPDPATTPRVSPPAGSDSRYLHFETNYQRVVAQEMHKRLYPRALELRGFLLQLVAAGWHRKTPAQLQKMADQVGRDRILVMHGTLDNTISVPHGRKLIEHIQPGKGLIVEGMGHAPLAERWEWFNSTLEDMFAKGEE